MKDKDASQDTQNLAANKSETARREEEVLSFWQENDVFTKSLEKDAPNGEFVFYDGPPFATGLPHHGHLLGSSIKDAIGRYKTMRGYHVRRRWGWDCHGLPIETLVEKELGLKTKKDIETIGIRAFNEKARSMVLQYVHDWERYVDRIGRWVDFKNSYKTMDNTFIESVWWALKQVNDKGLLYEGTKTLMYCTHCETPLAKAEIQMDNSYKDVTDETVIAKFKVKHPKKHHLPENTYILAWTTTPWTLPSNIALAVGKDIEYVTIEKKDEGVGELVRFTVAKEALERVFGKDEYKVVETMKGSKLVGLEYEPLFDVPGVTGDKAYKVYEADFVTTTDGTGIVHIAPAYGEDDANLGNKEKLPVPQFLNASGVFLDAAPEAVRGMYWKKSNSVIIEELHKMGKLFSSAPHTHSYPHCYRCGTPLIYWALPSWFVNIQALKDRLLEENENVNWVPDHLKHGRFQHIVENAPDWNISRNRFWASPLPIWRRKDNSFVLIGSRDELAQYAKKSGNTYTIMRHGEAENNILRVASGTPDIAHHVTAQGRKKVENAAKEMAGSGMDFDYVYVSPMMRTRETAEIIAEILDIDADKVIIDDRLREFSYGELDGKPISECQLAYPTSLQLFDVGAPGGDSFADVKKRVGEFIYEMEQKHADARILIVSHGDATVMMQAAAVGANREDTLAMMNTHYLNLAHYRAMDFVPLPHNAEYEYDLHRPYIDKVELIDENGEPLKRITEVIDCWFESGSMPFAEYNYPFHNKEAFERRSPGDFIAEYIAQTRTWFYYMHVMGVTLFDHQAYRNVVNTGTILAADGQKMSKSKKNYTDPWVLLDKFGADAFRFYILVSPLMQAEDFNFRDPDLAETHSRMINMLWNSYRFYDMYAKDWKGKVVAEESAHILDRWILARLNMTIDGVTSAMDAYDIVNAGRLLRDFLEDYSTWYLRRSRDRVKTEGDDQQYALAMMRHVLKTYARLIAPLMPFIAESVYRGLSGGEESVHLDAWPEAGQAEVDLIDKMRVVRNIVSRVLEQRAKAGIKVRQPLSTLRIHKDYSISKTVNEEVDSDSFNLVTLLTPDHVELIKDEVNVKNVIFVEASRGLSNVCELDTTITPALRAEGMGRDVVRAIQDLRKKVGLQPGEKAELSIKTEGDLKEVLTKAQDEIIKTCSLSGMTFTDTLEGEEIKVGEGKVVLKIE